MASPYAVGLRRLFNNRHAVPLPDGWGAMSHRALRHNARTWSAQALATALDTLAPPPTELVDTMLDLARGRVGGYMCPDTRNNAWAAFRYWRRVNPEYVPEATWRALGVEWALLCQEDFLNEFGTHVLTDAHLRDRLMVETNEDGGPMFWGATAVLPGWRDADSGDFWWRGQTLAADEAFAPPLSPLFAMLMASPYACGPAELARRGLDITQRVQHRQNALAWTTMALVQVTNTLEPPPPAFVQVMLDIARGRVGYWMLAETRNNAWTMFRHWRRTGPEQVPEAFWRALGLEWDLLSCEDFDNEFGVHVLQDGDLWNELMSDAVHGGEHGEYCMFWGPTAVLPQWRDTDPGYDPTDMWWRLPDHQANAAVAAVVGV
jgi:hypothetical protein